MVCVWNHAMWGNNVSLGAIHYLTSHTQALDNFLPSVSQENLRHSLNNMDYSTWIELERQNLLLTRAYTKDIGFGGIKFALTWKPPP